MTDSSSLSSDNLPAYSVSEISAALKRVVEGNFEHVRVRGEISQPSFPRSGHCYFRLKDENAVLDAVCWRGTVGRLALRPEEGLEVIATGRLTTYAGRSSYQIVVETLEPAGEGALLKLLAERRRRLEAEGLFAAERKKALPFLPRVIGVVTSPTGAVIRDILHRLADRFPRHVLVWPVAVQGETAAGQIAEAIAGFNSLDGTGPPRPDLLIVARGGGSLEDLWPFNEEIVVRAVAASQIPVISAVGHETDTTLIDFVADRRAPTPTAAAEIAVPVRADLLTAVMDCGRRVMAAAHRALADRSAFLEGLARGLPDPWRLLEEKTQRLDERSERLALAAAAAIERRGALVAELGGRLPHPRQQLRYALESLQGTAARLAPAGLRALRERSVSFERLDAERRLARAMTQRRQEAATALDSLGRLLESFSYHKTLDRGFAVVRAEDSDELLIRAAQVKSGQGLQIEFADGRAKATADGAGSRSRKSQQNKKAAPIEGKQGKLF